MVTRFGSEAAALDALHTSQERRLEALSRTRLPTVTIDTSDEDWPAYATSVATLA